MIWATVLTIVNKIFDVFPEILIGVAIDVVVNSDDSFVADLTGVESRWGQLVVLAAINVVVWIGESATEWGYMVMWRNLGPDRGARGAHGRLRPHPATWSSATSRTRAPAG